MDVNRIFVDIFALSYNFPHNKGKYLIHFISGFGIKFEYLLIIFSTHFKLQSRNLCYSWPAMQYSTKKHLNPESQ